jgi:fatty acid desaturase
MFVTLTARMHGVLRHSNKDAVLILLSLAYASLLFAFPSVPLIGLGLWWIANTVAHNFIHTPFFRSRALNRLYSIYLSALMGFPQELWRERHLRHHRGDERPMSVTPTAVLESTIVLGLWLTLAINVPWFFVTVYVPGYAAGLGLCFLQGYFEHAGGTTSHYGWFYNCLFFNDGYHVEHHRRPGVHWTRLPLETARDARSSRWPPVLRWLDMPALEVLERIALRSSWVQRYVLRAHEQAFRAILPGLPATRITIVGGGLFPRTALILRKLRPDASLTIVDASGDHLDVARSFLSGPSTDGEDTYTRSGQGPVELREQFFDPRSHDGGDLIVIPLSFVGNRDDVYRHPPAPAALVHDWLWNVRGQGVRVSWLLLKRLNLVTR